MTSILERYKKLKSPKDAKKTMEQHAEDALYREVWEDVNNEKTTEFLKKYAKPLIAGAIIILILATGFQLWRHNARTSRIAAAHAYETAIADMDANALAAMSHNTGGAMSDLALFQSFMLTGDAALLEQLIRDGSTRDFRDLARIHLATLKGDSMSAKDLDKFLAPLNTKSSPFYYSGMLAVAQKYLADGDKAAAGRWLDKIITDKNAPGIISATAESLR